MMDRRWRIAAALHEFALMREIQARSALFLGEALAIEARGGIGYTWEHGARATELWDR